MIEAEVMYRCPSMVSSDDEIELWADEWAVQNPLSGFGREGAAELAYQELWKVTRAHHAMLWLTKRDVSRKMAPVVADTALKLAMSVQKLGRFSTTMHNKSGLNPSRSDWWLLSVASMKHCGVFGTVVSVIACWHQ
jgi:hypothetical protein